MSTPADTLEDCGGQAGSFNAQVDALLCPGHLYRAEFDPEGPL